MAPTRAPILALLAHPDDELLGCGATLLKWKDAGHPLHIAFAGLGRLHSSQVEDAARVAAKAGWSITLEHFADNAFGPLVDLVTWAEGALRKVRPMRVILHDPSDLNQDHRLVAEAGLIACRPFLPHAPREIWSCEVPGAVRHPFDPSLFVDVSAHWQRKVALVQEYTSELRDHPHPRSLAALDARATYWGAHAGFGKAEAFRAVCLRFGQTSGTAS